MLHLIDLNLLKQLGSTDTCQEAIRLGAIPLLRQLGDSPSKAVQTQAAEALRVLYMVDGR